jgi:serine/threonine-protein kinase
VQQAIGERRIIQDVYTNLSPADKQAVPEIGPTVDSLLKRITELAEMVARLDAGTDPHAIHELTRRIAAVQAEPDASAERERRLTLLVRQKESLEELVERRRTLFASMESAALLMQNLKLDMLKLRSSGVQSALGDVTSATQEARALSRDIGHVLDAADDVRSMKIQ